MKNLLTMSAVIEVGAGLALLALPAALLFGPPLDTPAGATVVRVAGAALLAIGVACWLARGDSQSRAARGLISALVIYNAGTVIAMVYAGLRLGLSSSGLWPAALIHAVMTVWCVASLLRGRATGRGRGR
ncbi:MAG: hypothetical protein FIB04_07560 [Gammaproteobacteria bacterium]|nr:hypothetical protein [Gammaproteobacteria bacterium]